METSEAVLARIRKLLAMAEHPGTPPAEAEAAGQAAERLVAKYAVDAALIEAKEDLRSRPVMRTMTIESPYASAKVLLLNAVASAHGVRVITTSGNSARATVIGFDGDLRLVDLLFTSLLLQAAASLRREANTGRAFRRAFLIGFAREVGARLRKARENAVAQTGDPSTELAIRDRLSEVDDAVREHFPRLVTYRTSFSDHTGLAAGHRSGATASLSTGARDLGGRRTPITAS